MSPFFNTLDEIVHKYPIDYVLETTTNYITVTEHYVTRDDFHRISSDPDMVNIQFTNIAGECVVTKKVCDTHKVGGYVFDSVNWYPAEKMPDGSFRAIKVEE